MKKRLSMSWSGGKDSALALYKILIAGEYDVISLHTVFDAEAKRVGMHGIQEALIEQQAQSIGIPLVKLYLNASEHYDAYTQLMKNFYSQCVKDDIECIGFGDIFLEDLRLFREQLLTPFQLRSIYPLWQHPSDDLVEDFLNLLFRTIICCANQTLLGTEFVGKVIDKTLISKLPGGVDPCGENGEFHTFVFEGPIFSTPIKFSLGPTETKKYSFKVEQESGDVVEHHTPFIFQEIIPS